VALGCVRENNQNGCGGVGKCANKILKTKTAVEALQSARAKF
jgi:hypothetical protein